MVFQNYALYPHMTVADNMGFALKIAGVNKAEIRKKVEEAAKILDLTPYLDRKPKALSGGQRQRASPWAAPSSASRRSSSWTSRCPTWTPKLRVSTRTQIASLQRRLGITTVYVTHDQVEALTMGDRVAVLKTACSSGSRHPAHHSTTARPTSSSPASSAPRHEPRRGPDRRGGVMFGDSVVPVSRDALSRRRQGATGPSRSASAPSTSTWPTAPPPVRRPGPRRPRQRRRGARRRRLRPCTAQVAGETMTSSSASAAAPSRRGLHAARRAARGRDARLLDHHRRAPLRLTRAHQAPPAPPHEPRTTRHARAPARPRRAGPHAARGCAAARGRVRPPDAGPFASPPPHRPRPQARAAAVLPDVNSARPKGERNLPIRVTKRL